ncbi:MAG: hypothetical protein E6G06_15100 [Actinobacteria bacterium]|nr:MAG: hypothetical protein E6G06_15100 [Actinomycetota bacterium]
MASDGAVSSEATLDERRSRALLPPSPGSDASRPGDQDRLTRGLRLALGVFGCGFAVAGVASAFVGTGDASTAVLVSAGTAVMFVAYLGPYITHIKFQQFEADLEAIRQTAVREVRTVKDEAVQTVQSVKNEALESVRLLQESARSFEGLRTTMPGGGERDIEFDKQLRQAEAQAREGRINTEQVAEWLATKTPGNRILALGAMRGDPRLLDFDQILDVIDDPHGGFDQDRFLLLVAEMIPQLNDHQRLRLRRVIEHQRSSGEIKPQRIRWLTSERILRLLTR